MKSNAKGARFTSLSAARGIKSSIAKTLGLDLPVINNWKARGVPATYANAVAAILHCDPEEISDIVAVSLPATTPEKKIKERANVSLFEQFENSMPLISWVKAGAWCESPDNFVPGDAEEWLPRPTNAGLRSFAVRVEGDSMTSPYPGQRSYPQGLIIYVDPDRDVTNGCRVVARVGNEHTFKVYTEDAGRRFLKPINPQYPMIDITDDVHICGVVFGSYMPE